jgi:predicted tellurium resistance membrane protein TerC
MLKTGEWLSFSIVGLVVLFIFLTVSFYSFLIGPDSKGPQTTVEPSSSFIQIVFISIGPAIALSFFTNAVSKDTSKLSSLLVMSSGIVLIIGMVYVSLLVPQVQSIELPIWISNIPLIFIGFGVLLFLIGISAFRQNKKKQNNQSLDYN